MFVLCVHQKTGFCQECAQARNQEQRAALLAGAVLPHIPHQRPDTDFPFGAEELAALATTSGTPVSKSEVTSSAIPFICENLRGIAVVPGSPVMIGEVLCHDGRRYWFSLDTQEIQIYGFMRNLHRVLSTMVRIRGRIDSRVGWYEAQGIQLPPELSNLMLAVDLVIRAIVGCSGQTVA